MKINFRVVKTEQIVFMHTARQIDRVTCSKWLNLRFKQAIDKLIETKVSSKPLILQSLYTELGISKNLFDTLRREYPTIKAQVDTFKAYIEEDIWLGAITKRYNDKATQLYLTTHFDVTTLSKAEIALREKELDIKREAIKQDAKKTDVTISLADVQKAQFSPLPRRKLDY